MKGLGYSKFAGSTGGIITFGAISGGIGAELTGGNFWQGAITGGIVAGLNTAMHKMGEDGEKSNTQSDDTIYSENQILTSESGTSTAQLNVEYKYKIVNGNKVVIDNTVRVNTSINDILSPIDKYYENKCFDLTVNPKISVRGNFIIIEAKGTYVLGSLKVGGLGIEVNPVINTFKGAINISQPQKSFAYLDSNGNRVGRLYQ